MLLTFQTKLLRKSIRYVLQHHFKILRVLFVLDHVPTVLDPITCALQLITQHLLVGPCRQPHAGRHVVGRHRG